MEAALGTTVGTLQHEWNWTRALDAHTVGAAALMVVSSGDGVQWLSQSSVSAVQGTGDGGGSWWRLKARATELLRRGGGGGGGGGGGLLEF